MYPGPDVLMEVGRIAIAGARLDVQMGELWHHLDRSVSFEEARSEFGSAQRRKVTRLAEERLFGELHEQVIAAVQEAWEASRQRNEVIHQGWLLRGPDAMRSWADWFAVLPEDRAAYLEEWDRESKDSPNWQRVPMKTIDVFPAQPPSELRDIETGNTHARRLLIEAAWHHRSAYRPSKTMQARWELAPPRSSTPRRCRQPAPAPTLDANDTLSTEQRQRRSETPAELHNRGRRTLPLTRPDYISVFACRRQP
jgi:hypothetical protein